MKDLYGSVERNMYWPKNFEIFFSLMVAELGQRSQSTSRTNRMTLFKESRMKHSAECRVGFWRVDTVHLSVRQ